MNANSAQLIKKEFIVYQIRNSLGQCSNMVISFVACDWVCPLKKNQIKHHLSKGLVHEYNTVEITLENFQHKPS